MISDAQQQLADEASPRDGPVSSEDEIIFDLINSCGVHFGKLAIGSNPNATRDDYEQSRRSDIFILRKVQSVLPYLQNSIDTYSPLAMISSHMCTIEGQEALYELIKDHYKEGIVPSRFDQIMERYGSDEFALAWKARFQYAAAIRKEEYQDKEEPHQPTAASSATTVTPAITAPIPTL